MQKHLNQLFALKSILSKEERKGEQRKKMQLEAQWTSDTNIIPSLKKRKKKPCHCETVWNEAASEAVDCCWLCPYSICLVVCVNEWMSKDSYFLSVSLFLSACNMNLNGTLETAVENYFWATVIKADRCWQSSWPARQLYMQLEALRVERCSVSFAFASAAKGSSVFWAAVFLCLFLPSLSPF